MMYYSVMTQAYSELKKKKKEIPSSPNRSRTCDLPITSSDALPLSYRRLVGANAIKRGLEAFTAFTAITTKYITRTHINNKPLVGKGLPIRNHSLTAGALRFVASGIFR